MKKILFFLIIFVFGSLSVEANYSIYYGTNQKLANMTFSSDLVILQDYNFDLYKNYKGKKICYLSVGEADETSENIASLGLTKAVLSKNEEWNSYIMDMTNEVWINYVLEKEEKLKKLGCHGLFLDTVWQENQDSGAIALINKIQSSWSDAYIIVNNAHTIKEEVKDFVNGYMFENFWDYGTKIKSDDALWYIGLFKEYSLLGKQGEDLYALTYANPSKMKSKAQKKWYAEVLKLAIFFGFDLRFSSYNLDKVY